MKKKVLIVAVAAFVCVFGLSGCFGSNNNKDNNQSNYWTNQPSISSSPSYNIQYSDDSGIHKISVRDGSTYSLEAVPEREGYNFLGLFDSAVGGVQYVLPNGACAAPFSDGKDVVLFPQFEPKKYTVILDYQGAKVIADRQLSVNYDESFPELPKNLELEHKVFNGWYTQENCEGVKISDEYGLIPLVSVLNSKNFDINEDTIYLYAGFTTETFKVLCCFTDDVETETVVVEYDTPVSEIIPKTRVDKKVPIVWSKTYGGEPFNGKITSETVLYAVEYAPVIDLDLDGGDGKTAYVVRAGSNISLPIPTKDYCQFSHWVDAEGNEFTDTTMPEDGAVLKAVWQPRIVLDSNGGDEVDDVSAVAGASITLPVPTRDGYVFAGWYTTKNVKYAETKMPKTGFDLKAGWYKITSTKINLVSGYAAHSATLMSNGSVNGPAASWRIAVDLSKYIPSSGADIKVVIHLKMRNTDSSLITTAGVYLYDNPVVSDAYLLQKAVDTVSLSSDKDYTFTAELKIRSSELYLCYYAKRHSGNNGEVYYSDVWLEVEHPDASELIL